MFFSRCRYKILPCAIAAGVLFFTAASPYKAFGQEDEQELFLIAEKAFEDGFYDVAIRYINDFLQKYPQTDKRIEANLLLGQCYFFKNQYLKAFDIFQSLLSASEFKDATLFWLGETYLKGSDYTQAEKQYRQVIEIYPESAYVPQAYYSLGWTYFDQRKYGEASQIFRTLVKKFPVHQLVEDAWFKLGECEYNQKNYEEALHVFHNYVQKFPSSTRHDQAYFYMAESHYYQEHYPEAISYYSKVQEIASDPKLSMMAKVSLGWSYLKKKDFDQAEKTFNEALAMAQKKGLLSDDIYLGQASLYTEMGQNEKALAAYNQLITAFPNSSRINEALLGKANIQYLLKNYSAAIETYRTVIQSTQQHPENREIREKATFGLGWAHLKNGDAESAIKSFENIMANTNNKIVKVSALTQIGDAYQDEGDMEKAVSIYDKILHEYPDSLYGDYVQYREAIALLKMDKLEAATLALQSLKANFPQSKFLNDSQYYLGVAYFKKGEWARAREQMENFLAAANRNSEFTPEANYILALSFFNLNEIQSAMKNFEKIIKDYPGEGNLLRHSELGIAKCLYKAGQAKEAIKRFKIISYKYPKTEIEFEALRWLGNYYLENTDYPNAVDYYQQIVSKFPGSDQIALIHYELGQAYQAQGSFDKAISEYKLIAPHEKELYAKASLSIADIFSKELDLTATINTYQNIADTSPSFKRDAYLKMAEAYQVNKEWDKAIKTYQKALSADIGLSQLTNAELQFKIADTYELLHKPAEAIEAYLKIPYLYSNETAWVTKAYLRMARIFEDQEDWKNAKLTYEKILLLKTEEVKFAQERLDWMKENITPAEFSDN